MNQYTIYCTSEQTKKALELGAPIWQHEGVTTAAVLEGYYLEVDTLVKKPTAEQMIGWLRKEKGLFCEPYLNGECRYGFSSIVSTFEDGEIIRCEAEDSIEKAILAAIDAALSYLSNKHK